MIELSVLHTFMLVGSTGRRTALVVADMEDRDADMVFGEVGTAVASPLTDAEEHEVVRNAAERAFVRAEETPGTMAVAAERIPGNRLIRVFRHLAGEGPFD